MPNADLAIPFKLLRCQKKEDAVWQYSFSYQQINEHRITDIWLLLDKCDCDKVLYT